MPNFWFFQHSCCFIRMVFDSGGGKKLIISEHTTFLKYFLKISVGHFIQNTIVLTKSSLYGYDRNSKGSCPPWNYSEQNYVIIWDCPEITCPCETIKFKYTRFPWKFWINCWPTISYKWGLICYLRFNTTFLFI